MEKNLQRLSFSVLVKAAEDTGQTSQEPAEFSFIYGIGTAGLSDFEMAINGLGMDELHQVEMVRGELAAYFGWLFSHLHKTLDLPDTKAPLLMEFSLKKVSSPEPREIVRAIAELQGHGGCGTDCGCGCH